MTVVDTAALLYDCCTKVTSECRAALAGQNVAVGDEATMPGLLEEKGAIRDLLSRIARPPEVEQREVHAGGNVLIKIDGDRAHVRSHWLCAENSRRGPVVAAEANIDDLVKQDRRWVFQHRRIDRFVAGTRGPAHQGG